MDRKIVVSRLWKKRGIQQYFSLLQFSKEFWDFEIDAHILIDDWSHKDDWTDEIVRLSTPHRPNFPMKITFYTIEEIENWLVKKVGISAKWISKFDNFKHIYHLLLYFYLYKEKGIDYLVSYDDDVVFNKKVAGGIDEVDGLITKKIPFVIDENHCPISDKGMFYKLCKHFDKDLTQDYYKFNPNGLGVNAGFMGIDLDIIFKFFEDDFEELLSLFDYTFFDKSLLDLSYTFAEKRLHDTQEQSFLSIMTHCFSSQEIFRLSNNLGYFFDTPIQEAVNKSKLIHFTGDRKYDPIFPKVVIEFLKNNGHKNVTTEWFYY